jgi:hypothetical protein
MREFSNVIALVTTPLFAFFLRWQMWRSKRNYVETLAYMCFVSAHAHLFMMMAVLIEWISGTFYEDLRGFILVIYLYLGHRVFYNMGHMKTFFVTIGSLVLFAFAAFLTTAAFVALRMSNII